MNNLILALAVAIMAAAQAPATSSPIQSGAKTDACTAWVDSVYNSMTIEERVGQMVFVNLAPNLGSQTKSQIKSMVDKYHIGGLFLSKGTAEQFAEMNNYAQSVTKVPILTCIDGEWGPAMRVTDCPDFPYNMALGAISDMDLLYRYGEASAEAFKALGIYMNFGPVLDVNNNPSNPVIGYRSFGEDPFIVGKQGRAYSLGLEANGVLSVAKHFPGHGDTNVDSHKALPTIHHPEEMLDTVDLVPFKTYIDADLSGMMVGHLNVPALDKSGRPASMSHVITTEVLKDDMGFRGLVITDGLGMAGASVKENICVAAIKAGNDVLLGPPHLQSDIQAVIHAIETGQISQETIERSCKKILSYKYALGLTRIEPASAKRALEIMDSPKVQALQQDLADASITVLGNTGNILPLGDLATSRIALVNIGAPAKNDFTDYCRRYTDVDVYSDRGGLSASTLSQITQHDVVVAAVYTDNASATQTLGSLRNAKNLVVVTYLIPYKLAKFRGSIDTAKALMLAYDKSAYAQRAAAMALFGGIKVDGRLPVNVGGIGTLGEGAVIPKCRLGYSSPAAKGMRADLQARFDDAVRKAIDKGAFPGAQVLVVKDGDVIIDRSYGHTTKGGDPVDFSTIYDLASVSKTVGTLPGVMKAYDLGLFALDTPAYNYIPGLNVSGKREITPKMLLFHETGMPPSLNMFNTMMDPDTYTGQVVTWSPDADHTIAITGGGYGHKNARLRTDITSPERTEEFDVEAAKGIYVGQCTYDTIMANIYRAAIKQARRYEYSCLNFCLLMDLEQRVTGIPHSDWVTDSIWAPLGAKSMCYRPTEKFPLSRIAATENDTYLRKQHLQGYVHDELANFSGGIQGNAGVFGNANDIAKLCQMWLNGGVYGDARVLCEKTTELFTTAKSPTCRRGLGFDKPDFSNRRYVPGSKVMSPGSYGHTGFTGTCFWVDPEKNLIYIFLSNRVDPSRSNKAFTDSNIRDNLLDMVYDAL